MQLPVQHMSRTEASKMAILNAAFYLNHSRVFGWQILKSVVPTDASSTIFHNAVLPSVVDDVVIIESVDS